MKAAAIREQTDDEVRELLRDTTKEFFGLKVKKGMGDSSQQPLRIRQVRRDLARIKTVMRERGVADHG